MGVDRGEVIADELIGEVYQLDVGTRSFIELMLQNGELVRSGGIDIEWHDKGFELRITNTYDVGLDALTGGGQAKVHRKGTDTFTGVLTPRLGGAYYAGTVEATSDADSQMDFFVPVAGERCEDSTNSTQRLDVVGIPIPAAPVDPQLDVLGTGQFGTQDLVLRFYPASPPGGSLGRCQGTIDYAGPGPGCFLVPGTGGAQVGPTPAVPPPDRCPPDRQIRGAYLAYNDARITDPISPAPLVIHLPPRDGALDYEDWRQVLPAYDVDSVFRIVVAAFSAP